MNVDVPFFVPKAFHALEAKRWAVGITYVIRSHPNCLKCVAALDNSRTKPFLKICFFRSRQRYYILARIKNNIKQSKINEHETPLDEILYDQISVGENMDKQSRTSTRKSRTKLLYVF